MARLWSCGFELQSVAAGVEFDTPTGSLSISTSVTHAGSTASLRCNPTSATAYIEHQLDASGTVKRTFHRFYLRVASYPAAATAVYAIGQSGFFPTYLRLYPDGTLRLYDGNLSTEVGTSSSALALGTWYRVEIDHTDAATGTAPVVAYLDGVNFSGTASISVIGGFSRIRAGVYNPATTADIYIDDIAVNDTIGTVQTGLPGAGAIVHLHPAAAGDSNGWATAVGGTAGVANNYTRVSEVSPDNATSYNQTATASVTDDFKCGTSAAAGISAGSTVSLVQVGMRAGSTATTSGPTATLRIKGQAGGTVSSSAAVAINTNGFATNGAAAPHLYPLTAYTNPQTSSAWTTSALDTMQIGYASGTGTTTRRVSTLWALVEYVPSSGSSLTASPAETTTLTDGVAATWTLPRSQADGTALGDTAAAARQLARGPADTTLLGDQLAAARTQARPATDTGTLADTATRSAGLRRAQADTSTLADAAAAAASRTRAPADSGTLADTTATARTKPAADSASLVDQATPTRGHAQAAADSTSLTDAPAAKRATTAGDTGALADSPATVRTALRAPADTAALSDAAVRSRTGAQADTAGVTDTAAARRSAGPVDTAGLVDTAAAALARPAAVGDSAALADAAAPTAIRARMAADSVLLGDTATVSRHAVSHEQPADPASLGDTATVLAGRARTGADTVSLVDAVASSRDVTAADTAALSDGAVTSQARVAGVADGIGLADTVATTSSRSRPVADATALTDDTATSQSSTASVHTKDPAALGDTLTATAGRTRTAADGTAATDTATAGRGLSGTDGASLVDQAATVSERVATPADSVSLGDTAAAAQARVEAAADSALLGDTWATARAAVRPPGDVSALADRADGAAQRLRPLGDTGTLTDHTTVRRTATAELQVDDAGQVVDDASLFAARGQSPADTVVAVDAASASYQRAVSVGEGGELGDEALPARAAARSVADVLAAEDDALSVPVRGFVEAATLTSSAGMLAVRARPVADTVALVDSVVVSQRGPLDIVLTVAPLPPQWEMPLQQSGWELELLRPGWDTPLLPPGWDTSEVPSGWETDLLDGG